ncbi:AraC family transcriptional regulator [Roseomonas sp. SSH11]|uniref:AraC family transcriptional regulator n=1 Tax=Pararoseomonas baculiformis TaxID=2820812 RepID=A0ABS4ACM4_9PROT|nr:AraC family transcriptional regulator [Pararoseomonas baculiformis]MBP0444750.1 AraC family transcriptional regulator [Pararoseomonas baculiformis]
MSRHAELALLIDRLTEDLGDGIHTTRIPRLALIRSAQPTDGLHTVYGPSVCIVAQGTKRTIAGEAVLDYAPGHYLIVSVEIPVIGQVTRATAEEPYLCLRLDLDPAMLGGLLIEAGMHRRREPEPGLGIMLSYTTPEIMDAVIRLTRLLSTPGDIPVLAPLVERELLYRLVNGDQAAMLHGIAMGESRAAGIARAVNWIKDHFREPLRVEKLAEIAHMSPSALHQHFKTVTAMSPLQYQKQLRLQEARRLILSAQSDAAGASFAVGYGSPSQFSREYARLFGAPPLRDIARLRGGEEGARMAASG